MNAERSQITIGLGDENYWLSIVEFRSDDYHTKELALVVKCPSDFFGVSLVPLRGWYDGSSSYSDEQTIDLLVGDGLRPVMDESVVLCEAIAKARAFLSRFRGFELDSEENR